jgi:hypothetical protein
MLQVVTTVLLTVDDFPGELGEGDGAACAALTVQPRAKGYGLVLSQDGTGGWWTQITTDVDVSGRPSPYGT